MTSAQWLEVVTSYSLQVFVVIAACTVLERTVAKTSDRCAIWSSCFLCVLLLGCSALMLPRLHLVQPWSHLEPHILVTISAAQNVLGRIILAVWALGASFVLIRWIIGSHKLRCALRRCEQLHAHDVARLLGQTSIELNGRPLPIVLISDESESPFCWQLHEPTIVLPRFLLQGSHEDLRHVLLHELEHLATNHPLQLFWQHTVQVACWFHPAVWNAAFRASLMREYACDEAAANQGFNSAAYLRTLLHIAERCKPNHNSSAITFGRMPSEIVLRARRLVNLATDTQCRRRRTHLGRRLAIGILFGLTALISLVWIPSDPLASPRSIWSPWPHWSAKAAHCFGCNLRDYEQYDRRSHFFEIVRKADQQSIASAKQSSRDVTSN